MSFKSRKHCKRCLPDIPCRMQLPVMQFVVSFVTKQIAVGACPEETFVRFARLFTERQCDSAIRIILPDGGDRFSIRSSVRAGLLRLAARKYGTPVHSLACSSPGCFPASVGNVRCSGFLFGCRSNNSYSGSNYLPSISPRI